MSYSSGIDSLHGNGKDPTKQFIVRKTGFVQDTPRLHQLNQRRLASSCKALRGSVP